MQPHTLRKLSQKGKGAIPFPLARPPAGSPCMSLSLTITHPCSSNEPRICSRSCDSKERSPAKPLAVFSCSIDLCRPKLRIQQLKRRAISDLGVINGHPCFINRRRATILLTFAKSMHPTQLTHLSTLAPGRSSTGMTSEMLRFQDPRSS